MSFMISNDWFISYISHYHTLCDIVSYVTAFQKDVVMTILFISTKCYFEYHVKVNILLFLHDIQNHIL